MPWVESLSPSFRARHDDADADDVERVLHSLELTRERLSELFSRTPEDVTVVFHRSSASLAMARPLVPLARLATAPAARRYVAGWPGREELHVITPAALRARGGSYEMLELTAAALYAHVVVADSNPDVIVYRKIR